MCKHADQLTQFVHTLQTRTYPYLESVITHAASCKQFQENAPAERQVAEELMQGILSEFHSLATYEQRLVFPAILGLFGNQQKAAHTPDLANLLQLTKSKEHRLQHLIKTLETILHTEKLKDKSACPREIVTAFTQRFFPEKTIWNELIEHRINSCACFRRGFIAASGFEPDAATAHSTPENPDTDA